MTAGAAEISNQETVGDMFEALDQQEHTIYAMAHLYIRAYEAAQDPARAYSDLIREADNPEYAWKGSAGSALGFARLNLHSVLIRCYELIDKFDQ